MATQTDTIRTQFVVAGHGAVASAMGRIASAATLMASAVATAGAAAAGGIVALGTASVKTAGEFQMLQARMDSVFRSAAGGKHAFAWATQFAKETPFALREVVDAMTTMQALGLNPFTDLRTIGDASAALGLGADGIRRITMQLGQMKAIGRVSMEDLRVLGEAGIPIFDILKSKLGLTNEQMKRIGELGLDAEKTINALYEGMDDAFGGGMAKMMDTIPGKISNMMDAWDQFKAAVGRALAPTVIAALGKITEWLENKSNIDKVLVFASYITAGFQTAAKMASGLMKVVFGEKDAPRWIYQMKGIMADMMALWLATIAAIKGVEGASNIAIGAATGNPALAVAGTAQMVGATVLGGMAAGIHGRAKAAYDRAGQAREGTGFKDLFSDFTETQKAELARMRKAAGLDTISTLVDTANMAGKRDVSNPLGQAAGNGLQGIVEQIILGGGARAGRGIKAMDINRRLLGGGKPVVEVRVKSEDGTKLGQAVAEIAQKSATDIIAAITQNPRLRTQLKAALAQ